MDGILGRLRHALSLESNSSTILPGARIDSTSSRLGINSSSSSSGSSSGNRQYKNKRRLVTLALFSIASLSILALFYLLLTAEATSFSEQPERAENDSTGDRRRYGVVIDAGSSGSRAMIYAWDDPALQQRTAAASNGSDTGHLHDSMHLPIIERAGEHWTEKITPGISSFADRPRLVGIEHIKPLLDFAQKHIPRRQIAQTPVYLLATAGMRLLPLSHQALLMDTACTFARANYEFLLPDCQESFHVVSGELEGLYGWVAVNYLLDGFTNTDQGRWSHGFLDMGGASAQIAFEPAKMAAQIHQHDLAQVTLRSLDGRDRSFGVFVATFLGHGTNEARRRYVDLLRSQATMAEGANTPSVDDPCLAVGLTLPTVDGQAVLRGNGNFASCLAATEPLLNKTACAIEPCLFSGVHAPEIDFGRQSFVGVSEYWYASHDYLGLGGVWDVNKFEEQATDFCQTPWADVRQRAANDPQAIARLQMQCFKAAWLVNVLHKGFGVPRGDENKMVGKLEKQAAPFQSVNQVGDVEVSWTLGALLLRVSRTIPPSYQTLKAKTTPGIVLPDNMGVDAEEAVELVDDSLWSPLKFVGIRRLLVLWALQPTRVRVLLLVIGLCTLALLVGLLYWSFKRRSGSYKRVSASPERAVAIPLTLLMPSRATNTTSMPRSASQLGIAEASSYYMGGSGDISKTSFDLAASPLDESDANNGKELRRSPSMFVLDMLPRPLQSVLSSTSRPTSPPIPGIGEHRTRSVASLANNEQNTPISRSSSFNSLLFPNRRRGGGNE
ncbi:Golgi apyrase [Coemansia sp. Benny D115]|nr:Golgi apyrase [Coemansia sp. Benny D115]